MKRNIFSGIKIFIALLMFFTVSGCSNDKEKTKIYLDKALAAIEKKDYDRGRKWIAKLEKLKEVDYQIIPQYLSNENEQYRWFLIETLGNLKGGQGLTLLLDLLDKEENIRVKLFIIESLGKLRDKQAVSVLEEYLKDEIWGVRIMTAEALENITGKKYTYKDQPE